MKKGMGTMDKILIILAVFLLGFVTIMIWLYLQTGAIPDTLCTCVFGICGGEAGIMGWIKTTKERRQERKYELEDLEHEEKFREGKNAREETL